MDGHDEGRGGNRASGRRRSTRETTMHEEGYVDDRTLTGPPTEHDVEADEPTRETPVVEASWIPPTPPATPATPAEPPRRWPGWLAPAVVGALVGAAVSGGIVAIAKDNGSS